MHARVFIAVASLTLLIGPSLFAYSQDECDVHIFTSVPMADGTLIRTRISLPLGDGPWPVVLTRTPYSDGELCWSNLNQVTNYGYAHVNQGIRGSFGSEGEKFPFVHDAWGANQDGYDTVEWILQQPWCNGVVGLYGGSLRGAMTSMTAGSGPPNIYGEWLANGPADFYRNGVLYFGGALRWDEFQYMRRELGPLWEAAMLEHPTYDAFWQGLDVTTRQPLRDHPVVTWAGWYDTYQQSAIDNFVTIRRDAGPAAREHSKLIIALTGHGIPGGDVVWPQGSNGPGIDYGRALFEDYLKGIGDLGDCIPRVCYYLMGDFDDLDAPGNLWRFTDDWPVPAAVTPLYLHANRSLQLAPPAGSTHFATYAFDPNNPVPTLGGAVHGYPAVQGLQTGSFDQRPIEGRPDVILFETEPLRVSVEIVGRLSVTLWASSDAVDTDFTAKLTDVYSDGKSIVLNDGIIRARARDSLTDHALMTPGVVYEFSIDLWSTAIVFNRGHRIRLAISSSNFPRFDVNPNTGADLAVSYSEKRVANNTIYFDSSRPSHILLPITGPDTDDDHVADFLDAFPYLSSEAIDADGDGLGDNFEWLIINADSIDAIESIDDVDPIDDFDSDGRSNGHEFQTHSDPTDPNSVMPVTHWAYVLLTALIAIAVLVRAHRAAKRQT